MPSYSDGVPDWSGVGTRIAPTIEPGDSFIAQFTPPRSGTFIYHAHASETFQVNLGLYGALLLVDSGRYDPAHERLIYRPAAPGLIRLEVMQRTGAWKMAPRTIRVDP